MTTTHQATFMHVLNIMDIDEGTKEVLVKNGIKSVPMLASCSEEDLTKIQSQNAEVMLFGHIKSLHMFKLWCKKYADSHPDDKISAVNWNDTFIHEIWDDFLLEESRNQVKNVQFEEDHQEILASFSDASRLDIRPFTLKSNLEQPILIFLILNLVKAAASILPKYIQQSWPLKEFTQTKFKISQNTGYFRVCLKLYWLTFLKKIIRFLKPPKAHLSNGNVSFLTNFKGTRSATIQSTIQVLKDLCLKTRSPSESFF